MVTGPSQENDLASAASSSVKLGHKGSWGGNELRARSKMVRQGSGWVMEGEPAASPFLSSPYTGSGSPYPGSPYLGGTTPAGSPFLHQQQQAPPSPYLAGGGVLANSAVFPPTPAPGASTFSPAPRTASYGSGTYAPPQGSRTSSFSIPAGTPPSAPGTPAMYASFPSGSPTPSIGAPPRKMDVKKDD